MAINKINHIPVNAQEALRFLKEGNNRFVNNISKNRDLLQKVLETKEEQRPFAAILSCMDSRVPAELIFDQGIGDIFSIRIAGNIISENVLGSLEYAVEVAGSKLIVVMGHTNCGAIKGACDNIRLGNLSALIDKIAPAIYRETSVTHDRNSHNHEFVNKVAHLNVHHSVEMILKQSPMIKKHCEQHDVLLVAAMYDVASGIVHFHDAQDELIKLRKAV
ncbi:carbonic anhydrase [Arachidicoccus ginsenosidimutans]|uniref:carbonic anhydrase n=1 Tax=Arachidicoccus sp. BS20 TaxID=1850526 RepID=UPI0007F1045E|nr:carbonic anhydrase [Arachidicoccus sp. BS20]ANI87905.1 carbonic anhydrase [Arachidicoccus sp. BS20]